MTDRAEEGHNARVSGRRRFATKSSRAILALVLVGMRRSTARRQTTNDDRETLAAPSGSVFASAKDGGFCEKRWPLLFVFCRKARS